MGRLPKLLGGLLGHNRMKETFKNQKILEEGQILETGSRSDEQGPSLRVVLKPGQLYSATWPLTPNQPRVCISDVTEGQEKQLP